jgi:hypothetical protein
MSQFDLSGQHVQGDQKIAGRDQYNAGRDQYNAGRDQYNAGRDINIRDLAYDVHGLPSPYLGLRSFTYDERERYAGHDAAIRAAVALLTDPSAERVLLFITGASGSGKSSLAMAGLVPALQQHYAKRKTRTSYATCRPLRRPLASLVDALQQLGLPASELRRDPLALIGTPEALTSILQEQTPADQVNLLVLDQFEELLIQGDPQTDVAQRDALLGILAGLPSFAMVHTHIVVTMRSDYLPELFNNSTLYDASKQGIDLRAMTVHELKNAIQRPLQSDPRYEDKRWEPELTNRLAQEAAVDVTYLPLLQVTLTRIWDHGRLTLSSYGTPGREGSLTDAIREHTEAVYTYANDVDLQQPRSDTEQTVIMDLFLDLVEPLDDDPRHDVRRRRPRDVLAAGSGKRSRLIDELVNKRLLSVSSEAGDERHEEFVDIIHESLIRNWDRLRIAIGDKRRELQERARFEDVVQEWEAQGRADDYLLQGARLAEAHELAGREDIALRDSAGPGRMLLEPKCERRRLPSQLRLPVMTGC